MILSEADKEPEKVAVNENVQIIQEVFLAPLMESIYKRIDEMEKLQRKRTAWNRIRND